MINADEIALRVQEVVRRALPEAVLDTRGNHLPKFDFDEAALPRAAALMASAVAEFLN